MTTVNLDIVDLILDCDEFTPETYAAGQLRHADGRPFTDDEHHLIGQATRAELLAVRDLAAKAADHAREQEAAYRDLYDLVEPYATRCGPGATIQQMRALMTPEDQARLDDIASRINGLV